MIFVTDKGRLCNNIIQYAHLYAWGRENKRRTMSMRFAYKYPDFVIGRKRYLYFWLYLFAKTAARLHLIPVVEFNDINSDYAAQTKVMLTHRLVLATGWCVRFFDLFEKYKGEIKQLFAFAENVEQTASQRLSHCADGSIKLGVHVRRGDYATWCGGHYFFNDEQYARVIAQFCQFFPGKQVEVFVCGNDPKLDHTCYQDVMGASHVHFPNGSPAEDLCLLSHCDYLVGPPSTFTLVASMYHDSMLYWMLNADDELSLSSFKSFDQQNRIFDDLFIPS